MRTNYLTNPVSRASGLILACLFALAADQTVAPAQDLIIRGGFRFDTDTGTMVRNSGIVVSGGKIMALDETEHPMPGAMVIELGDDEFILPGIFDLHAHYNVNLFGRRRRDEHEFSPAIFLANGVTSTFPAGEFDPEGMRKARIRIARGEQPGPRLLNSGPYFGSARPGWSHDLSEDALRAEVDHWAFMGAAGFKAKGIRPAHLRALITRAHEHGLTVTGHLGSGFRQSVNPKDAILMGIDRIEHFLGGDALPPERSAYASLVDFAPGTPEFEDIAGLYLKYRVNFDVTLSAYGYFGDRAVGYEHWTDERAYFTPYMRSLLKGKELRRRIDAFDRIFKVKLKTIKAFYDAGGGDLITLGTDHPSTGEYLAGFSAHREMAVLVAAGLPEAAALRIATINGATALNRGNRFGSLAPGKFADLFVVAGNPLEEIRNTRRVRLVVKAGKLYESDALLASVQDKIGPSNEGEAESW